MVKEELYIDDGTVYPKAQLQPGGLTGDFISTTYQQKETGGGYINDFTPDKIPIEKPVNEGVEPIKYPFVVEDELDFTDNPTDYVKQVLPMQVTEENEDVIYSDEIKQNKSRVWIIGLLALVVLVALFIYYKRKK